MLLPSKWWTRVTCDSSRAPNFLKWIKSSTRSLDSYFVISEGLWLNYFITLDFSEITSRRWLRVISIIVSPRGCFFLNLSPRVFEEGIYLHKPEVIQRRRLNCSQRPSKHAKRDCDCMGCDYDCEGILPCSAHNSTVNHHPWSKKCNGWPSVQVPRVVKRDNEFLRTKFLFST